MYPNSVELMREMSAAGIEHRSDTPLEDDNMIDTIRVGWAGHHLPATTILFRVNDRGAHLEVERLGEAAPDKRLQALELLNDLNGTYRWVKFSMDEDDVLTCASDVFLVPEVAGLFGIAAMGRMFDTLDEVYPRLTEVMG